MSLFSVFSSQLHKHRQYIVYQHPWSSWDPVEAMPELERLLRFMPSTTREQQSSMTTSSRLRLSQAILVQYLHLDSRTRVQRQSLRMELCSFIMRSDAIISIRKVIRARYPRVQQQQLVSSSKNQMMRAAVEKPNSRRTRGPSLKIVVSIDRNVISSKCKINPYLNQHHLRILPRNLARPTRRIPKLILMACPGSASD